MQGAIFGGVIGSITGGIYSGIRANKMGLDFWNGQGLSRKSINLIRASGFNPNDPIEATDANLIKAREAWMPDAPMEYVKDFTVENVPAKIQLLMDRNDAAAATPFLLTSDRKFFTGRSSIYFNKNLAFGSAKDLYYTMAHEFIHVSQHALLKGLPYAEFQSEIFKGLKEYSAYNFQSHLGSTNYGTYSATDVKMFMNTYPEWFKKFQFYNFKWTANVSFSNIFK